MNKDIRYYLYLSKSKVDMLWDQLSRDEAEKISAELKINLAVFTGGLKTEPRDKNLYSKLDIVLSFLKKREVVGSIESPGKFFKGNIAMSWREYDFSRDENSGNIVLFSGYDEKLKKVVGLVGSAAHFIGMHHLEPDSFYYAKPSFWLKVADELNPPKQEEVTGELYEVENYFVSHGKDTERKLPKQKLEFVAKTFVDEEDFLLGSPIYVSEESIF